MKILKGRNRHIKKTKVFWEIANRYAVDSAWKYFCSKTKIQGSFHQLRKTYASYYMMAGGKLVDLQEILGHEDPATVRIYAALSPEHLQKNKDLVGF